MKKGTKRHSSSGGCMALQCVAECEGMLYASLEPMKTGSRNHIEFVTLESFMRHLWTK
jgi:hypothetical protein